MSVLKENECLNRARAISLVNIKTLNCWGSDLMDISIIEEMVNLEVLNVSVNNIVSLKNASHCPKLREIYMRRNKVSSLQEISYLKRLPQLKVLWLSDNPCSRESSYRMTILRNLPNLQKLDSIDVTPEELQLASNEGQVLEDLQQLPDFTGLNLNETLTKEMLQHLQRADQPDEKPMNDCAAVSKQENDNQQEETEDNGIVETVHSTLSTVCNTRETSNSNTYNAILLLLNELSQSELQEIHTRTEQLLMEKKDSIERLSILG